LAVANRRAFWPVVHGRPLNPPRGQLRSEKGQTRKYSQRADVFRFGPNNGHRSVASACPFGAMTDFARFSFSVKWTPHGSNFCSNEAQLHGANLLGLVGTKAEPISKPLRLVFTARRGLEVAKAQKTLPSKAGQIFIGVGGWTFPPWRSTFYPEKLPQHRELEYAASKLTSIEINGTYSQFPMSALAP
jgi:hypothetical protein